MKTIAFLISMVFAQARVDNKLIQAVLDESPSRVQKLAQDKKLLTSKDAQGQDAIFHAVSLNEPGLVKILIKAGAATDNFYGENKESLLFEAARLGSIEVTQMLIESNPQLLSQKNSNDETPLFEAVKANQNNLVQFLLKKGLKAGAKNKKNQKPSDFVASSNKDLRMILEKSTK